MKHADSIQSYKAYLANLEASTINNIQMWLLDYTCRLIMLTDLIDTVVYSMLTHLSDCKCH